MAASSRSAGTTGVHVVPVPGRLAGELDGVNTAEELAELRRCAGAGLMIPTAPESGAAADTIPPP